MTRNGLQEGSATVELVMIAPALVLLLAVMVGAGRLVSTKSALEAVAREAGRIASDSANVDSARSQAQARAGEVVSGFGLDPNRLEVGFDAGDFERGAPLSVTVSYPIRLADLPGFGLIPDSVSVSARHVETIERYGSRWPGKPAMSQGRWRSSLPSRSWGCWSSRLWSSTAECSFPPGATFRRSPTGRRGRERCPWTRTAFARVGAVSSRSVRPRLSRPQTNT